jgi:hypothetical protein
MILSHKDIAELADDKNQTRLVRYLAKRIVNMHRTIAFSNERCDALAGTLTHIACVSRKCLDKETKKWETMLDKEPDDGIEDGQGEDPDEV